MLDLGEDFSTPDGSPVKVIDFIAEDIAEDEMEFQNPILGTLFNEAINLRTNWENDFAVFSQSALTAKEEAFNNGIMQIQQQATDLNEIKQRETKLRNVVEENYIADLRTFALNYFEKQMTSSPDDTIRRYSTEIVVDKHKLSKIYFKNNTKVEMDEDRLDELVPRALLTWKYYITRCHFNDIREKLKQLQSQPGYDFNEAMDLMAMQNKLLLLCSQMAEHIGERVYDPLR